MGDSPLLLASSILGNDDEVGRAIERLLRSGADPNQANREGRTPLHKLCEFRIPEHVGLIERFLSVCDEVGQQVNIDARDNEGRTPLHVAMQQCRQDVVGLLLSHGADPNARDAKGKTPLHLTFAWSENKAFKTMLRGGADPNLADEDGSTPLHLICQRDHKDELVGILFEICDERQLTVQVNAGDKKGKTALHWALENILPNTVDVLLSRGADMSNCTFQTHDLILRDDPRCSLEVSLAAGTLAIAEHLEARGYDFNRSEALKIMNFFVEQRLFKNPSSYLEKTLRNQKFVSQAKQAMVVPSLSLYDLIHLGPEEEEKLLTYRDYFVFARRFDKLMKTSKKNEENCLLHLCEKLSRGFFRRWALDPFYELIHKRLPIICCEMVLKNLDNRDLCNICLAVAGRTSS
ncbi:ankyrin repeat domain-containing protein 27-like [Trichogramma pretiosum]|uniref:ankyrin repeat domain-containing protein 27-like n=1 Tax=Trichogramma pretiosum TaxID=7493 RepID=UPI000C719A55|nr:ankyrin repeat domain-containing protein 27-like [Trichogramma pretiosum]